jgi:hypothetical protein
MGVQPDPVSQSDVTLSLDTAAEVALATGTVAASVRLSASSADPLAVTVRIRTAADAVDWVFARDLLTLGLHEPVGDGAVRVRTVQRRGAPGACVEVLLRGREGSARLDLAHRDVGRFLELSEAVVRGEQSGRLLSLSLERELRDLLRDGDL